MNEALAVHGIIRRMDGFRGEVCKGGPLPFSIISFKTQEPSLTGKDPMG